MSEDIFTPRGIAPPWEPEGHVARAQGFERYEGATWRERRAAVSKSESTFKLDEHPDPRKSRRAWTTWLRGAFAVDGWAMPRHAPMPDYEDSDFRARPVAQLRPDVPVFGYFEWHSHREVSSWGRGGKPIRRLRAERRGLEEASPRTRHEAKVCDLDKDSSVRRHYSDKLDPDQVVLPTGHLHPETGEVVVPLEGRHAHWDMAKYLYTPGETAKRLGVNPLSLERRYEGDLFVVVLEGTLKMCAVTEAGYPCVDAGSVTLWGSATVMADYDEDGYFEGGPVLELHEFAERHLHGRTVAVVCDSDWYANPMVRRQTETVAGVLRPHVGRVVACAPPEGRDLGWHHPLTGRRMRAKRGVDDWLGEHERARRRDALLELGFYERLRGAELAAGDLPGRSDGRQTTIDVVRALGELASPVERVAPFSPSQLAATLGRTTSRVKDAYGRAVRAGLLKPLALAERKSDGAGGVYTETALVRVAAPAVPVYEWRTLRRWR